MRSKGIIPEGQRKESNEEKENKKRQLEIETSLKNYNFTKPDDLYMPIGEIWGGTTIFQYDKDQAVLTLIRDSELTMSDRPPEYLKSTWDKKWESMDFPWFQQHQHLSPG